MSTINLLFTLLYLAVAGACTVLWYKRDRGNGTQINISNVSFNKLYTISLVIFLFNKKLQIKLPMLNIKLIVDIISAIKDCNFA